MDFLPIFIDIKNRNCLVVGGGDVAARKVVLLSRAGARITLVSPQLGAELAGQVQEAVRNPAGEGEIIYRSEAFHPDHLDDVVLVIAATDDPETNRKVSEIANQRHIPVNVVDNPALCSFIMPAIIDRSPVLIAVSSGGTSPVLARLLRARLETTIPMAYGRLAAYAGDFRERVKRHLSQPGRRRRFWERALQGPFAEMVFAGKDQEARKYLERSLENESHGVTQEQLQGEVYLVGAGPGDPELLTFRAMRLMQQADVVVYDRLVSPEILDMVRRDAPRIYAGKERSKHTMPQESINELLVRLAKEGKRVLRLKGGDPFIFGRGGEEIETLSAEHIPFQVVPGITAANGAASYAGIPLTHRDYAQSCVFVTGHLKDGSVNLDWPMLARPNQTIVVYMGLVGLAVLCRQLILHGLPATTPAAIVQQGTTHKQRVLTGSLTTLPDLTASAHLTPPTLIIIGEVVKLHQKLAWFEPEKDLPAGQSAAAANSEQA
ncbi:siroheme synthase CysG [Nitrosovibrio tenuis]|uniref:Siroheme synthase n=1 Tax=Nitrosovibrio tenuis TaxID=1233 RepID=A0A1H7RUC0_9PROT|nr:siroheme synthase CysG [Nitrosovibrio tenuis]SEL63833.1 uroporphyrinogen-III C-methyltransferase /precorrin-2 dehydrogenase [Nitrosovibrio tenuis]